MDFGLRKQKKIRIFPGTYQGFKILKNSFFIPQQNYISSHERLSKKANRITSVISGKPSAEFPRTGNKTNFQFIRCAGREARRSYIVLQHVHILQHDAIRYAVCTWREKPLQNADR